MQHSGLCFLGVCQTQSAGVRVAVMLHSQRVRIGIVEE
jgi:hypothetical protein